MIKKIKRIFKILFSKRFVHPVVDERLSTAIDDKIEARKKAQENESAIYEAKLNEFVKTYFSKKYESVELMGVSFAETNRQWKKLCRDVNRRNKLINLNKNAFQNRVQLVINQMKQNGTENK